MIKLYGIVNDKVRIRRAGAAKPLTIKFITLQSILLEINLPPAKGKDTVVLP